MYNPMVTQHHPSRSVADRRHSHHGRSSRRDFLRVLMGGPLAGASILELAYHRAAWARAAVDTGSKLFDLEKAAEGIYFAQARPQTMINCNAAIFVGAKEVVVVDAHSKPSAATSLLGQIKREITDKPVRYVINTHFHWDHTQGDRAYKAANAEVEIIASETTKQLMTQLQRNRLKESLDGIPAMTDMLHTRLSRATAPRGGA